VIISADPRVEVFVSKELDVPGISKRSDVYRQGVRDCLLSRFFGVTFRADQRPPEGTVEFDAYFSGWERGWQIYEEYRSKHQEANR